MAESSVTITVPPAPEVFVNANGLTLAQKARYEAHYAKDPRYHPDQNISSEDRHFGAPPKKTNYFLTGLDNEDRGCETLGQMNLKADHNTDIPEGCTLTHSQQEKLFRGAGSTLAKTLYRMNRKNLELLKSETIHLLGCDNESFMKSFLTRTIHEDVRALIDGTIKRLPVKDEFMLHINEEGKPALAWMEMSMCKLHRLFDLLIHNIQGSKAITFVPPLEEATQKALEFMRQFKGISLSEHPTDTMRTTKLVADERERERERE
jgi:hypothetical protein